VNAADQYMVVKALIVGLGEALVHVEKRVDQLRAEQSAKSFDTRFGGLVRTVTKAKIAFTSAGVLDYARQHYPHEVTEAWTETKIIDHPATVHPSVEATLRKRFKIQGDVVIDPESGEVIDFAMVVPQKEHWTANLTDDAKASAANAMLERLDSVTEILELES